MKSSDSTWFRKLLICETNEILLSCVQISISLSVLPELISLPLCLHFISVYESVFDLWVLIIVTFLLIRLIKESAMFFKNLGQISLFSKHLGHSDLDHLHDKIYVLSLGTAHLIKKKSSSLGEFLSLLKLNLPLLSTIEISNRVSRGRNLLV